jgi:RNA polymerase sigma factor (sigma-70 family)
VTAAPGAHVDVADLQALRSLARALARADADADDLVQDTAVAAIEHPPDPGRPARPWLAAILRNRWRMGRRAAARRREREAAVLAAGDTVATDELVERARTLERLAAALVALEEPFRSAIILRYLDGRSGAEIAALLGVPAGTVRWRLKTGRDRLRAALADRGEARSAAPAVFALPLGSTAKGAVLVKAKTKLALVLVLLALVAGAIAIAIGVRGDSTPSGTPTTATARPAPGAPRVLGGSAGGPAAGAGGDAARAPTTGQERATVESVSAPGGAVAGRVVNWSTGDGVEGAELVFDGPDGVITVRSDAAGGFELAPAGPGRFRLAAVTKPGFLPYAPEWQHSTISVETRADRRVGGVTVFLFPAVDYVGVVVDAAGAPVAGAAVRLAGSPLGEQAIERLVTEWTTRADGTFSFNAPDLTVFEAVHGGRRGRAILDGDVALTHRMEIRLGDLPAADRTITGRVVDERGGAVADALVRAVAASERPDDVHAPAFAVSGADGRFVLERLEPIDYEVSAHADDRSPALVDRVAGGTRDLTLTVGGGAAIAGTVTTTDGAAVPAFTLLVYRRAGARRDLLVARSIVDPSGRFAVAIGAGDYELIAAASGLAPSAPTPASAGDRGVRVVVSAGAILRGTVVSAAGGAPLEYARVMREATGGGASPQPANAGTVTRADGTFELAGLPPGPVAIMVSAGNHHPRIEAGFVARDGEELGPVTIALAPVAPGERPQLELVGIGVSMVADGDAARIDRVIPGGGAALAGIVAGDRIVEVEGVPVAELGLSGAVARIRGVAGTTVRLALSRDGKRVELVVERRPVRA